MTVKRMGAREPRLREEQVGDPASVQAGGRGSEDRGRDGGAGPHARFSWATARRARGAIGRGQ